MPRTKKGTKRGNPNRLANRETRLQPDFIPFAATRPNVEQSSFSLQQEARNTSGRRDWGDQKLRNTKIKFVSAGTDRPSAIDPDDIAKMSLEDESSRADHFKRDEKDVEILVQQAQRGNGHPSTTMGGAEDGFIMDTMGTGPINTGLPPPHIRPPSPTPSDSSEEVILFKGRNNIGKSKGKEVQHKQSSEALDRKIRIVEDRIHKKEEELLESIHAPEVIYVEPPRSSHNKKAPDTRKSGFKPSRAEAKEHEDALLADYIANMEAEDSDEVDIPAFKTRELGGSDVEVEVWVDESNESSSHETNFKNPSKKDENPPSKYTWDTEDIDDLDDLPTSTEVFGFVQEILSKRDRPSGTQYLIVWDDHMRDECRWVPESTLAKVPGAASFIKDFEIEEKLVAEFQVNISTDDESLDDSDDEEEEEEDESEFPEEPMSDEQLARLLAKQEELGMGSERLILFDATAAGDEEGESRYIIREMSRPSRRGTKRPRGEFPAASALADAYDGFDVMDHDRPSLQKKSKGKKGKGTYESGLSDIDADLAAEMQFQYEKDREKKGLKKLEREELRALGLLGKGKIGKPDMKAKYKEGITMAEIKEEMKGFLLSDSPQFGLPPMEKAHRKLVHEIASAFQIKTTSYGSGKNRFPMLIRTGRTLKWNENLFNRLEDRLGRRFLPRMDGGKKYGGTPKPSGSGRGGGFNNSAVSYRDGEVVGGSAPELGIENKGRAMLEKMGWNKGDALGALNNKGILQPVSHVVKTTKAGLG